jgi:hypothetical protein
MEQFIDQKPLHLFTRQEFSQLNLPFPPFKERIGTLIRTAPKRKKKLYVFDASGQFEHLPLFTSTKNIPLGWLTKGKATHYNLSISSHEKPCGIVKLSDENQLRGLYNKSNDERFHLYKDLMLKEKEALTREELPFYTNDSLPLHFLPICSLKGYVISYDAEPVGVYHSKKEKKWMVLDMKKEIQKPHFSLSNIPEGMLTEQEAKKLKMEVKEKEMPTAYCTSYNDVVPLYDRRFHPKFKLRLLVGGTLHETI